MTLSSLIKHCLSVIFVSGDDVDAIALEVFNELNRLSEAEKKQDIKNEQADWTKTKRKFFSVLSHDDVWQATL